MFLVDLFLVKFDVLAKELKAVRVEVSASQSGASELDMSKIPQHY